MTTSATTGERHDRNERGASAVEYGLLVAAIAALIAIVVFAVGHIVSNAFENTCDTMAGATQVQNNQCGSSGP